MIDDHDAVAALQMAATYFRQAAAETAAEEDDGDLAWAAFALGSFPRPTGTWQPHSGLASASEFPRPLGDDSPSPRRGSEPGFSLKS